MSKFLRIVATQIVRFRPIVWILYFAPSCVDYYAFLIATLDSILEMAELNRRTARIT